MKVEIITIGDEILSGHTLNSNAAFIGKVLSDIQLDVNRVCVVGDNKEAILNEFKNVFESADIVLVSGGLGPTHDDITKKCIAEFFETELITNDEVLADIKEFFKKRNRKITQVNEDQALVPVGAKVIRNSRGTAPGIWMGKDKKVFVSMPGVPYEMKTMMEDSVIPMLLEMLPDRKVIRNVFSLLTNGIGESTLFEKLGNLDELLDGAKMAFLPNQFGVKMRMTVHGKDSEEIANKSSEIEQKIRTLVGRYIYGKDEELLEEVVAKLLIERCLTVSVAESCTGGLISARLTNVSGSSAFYERGLITYSNGAKYELLHVSEDMIASKGAVSLEVAQQMANGVRSISGTDIGLSATGIMGPTGATQDKPVGTVFIGLADDKVCTAKEFHFGEDRLLNKDRTSQAALEMLRRYLLGIPYDE